MKALRAIDKRYEKRIQERCAEEYAKGQREIEKQRQAQNEEFTRRTMKTFCVALNQEFGFGKDRLMRLISKVLEIGKEREQDEVFWAHIDRYVIEHIGLEFEREDYEKMDK